MFVLLPPNPPDLDLLKRLDPNGEVLLAHRDLARAGRLDDTQLCAAADRCRDLGLRPVLVWDLLVDDAAMADGAAVINRLDINRFDAVRVQDVGAAWYLREHQPQMPLQLILETGNHNLVGLRTYTEAFQPERLIVSNEIPIGQIKEMGETLDVPLEVNALGRILIFYTPRKLLSPIEPHQDEYDFLARFVTSIEDKKHFPIVENRHGTFMYYEKELFLLPYINDIKAAGINHIRLDFSFHDPQLPERVADWLEQPTPEGLEAVKGLMAARLTRGFFKSNRTDKQFAKLKNPHLDRREDKQLLGDVMDTVRGEFMAIYTALPFQVGDVLHFAIPEGELLEHEIVWIRDAQGQKHERAEAPGLWLINHRKKVSSGTRVYL